MGAGDMLNLRISAISTQIFSFFFKVKRIVLAKKPFLAISLNWCFYGAICKQLLHNRPAVDSIPSADEAEGERWRNNLLYLDSPCQVAIILIHWLSLCGFIIV